MSLSKVHHEIITCTKCARLRTYCAQIAREKRAAFRNDTYWGKPVPGFGDPNARVLILGLAPAAHGANRTGRVFTGDGGRRVGRFSDDRHAPERLRQHPDVAVDRRRPAADATRSSRPPFDARLRTTSRRRKKSARVSRISKPSSSTCRT